MRFAGQGLVAQPKWDHNPVMDEIPRWHNPKTGKLEPINPPETGHEWPDRGGGAVHGSRIMKPIGTEHPLDQPTGLDPYQDMNNVEVAGLPEALTEWITGTTRFPGAKTVDSWLDRKRSSGLKLPDVTSGTTFNLRGGNSLLQQPY